MSLVEFPADDPERAIRFWEGVLGLKLQPRRAGQGEGWQALVGESVFLGVHARGAGPGDRVSLPYFLVEDMAAAVERVRSHGGEVIHPGERWSVCRDCEGSSFGLAAR